MSYSKLSSYNRVPEPGSPRNTEAWALTQAALRMKTAQESKNVDEMVVAIRLNWRLWTIFQADLLEPDCPVPEEIRVNVLTLANFVDRHTVNFLGAPQPEMLNSLININRQLAAGLYAEPADAQQQTAEQPVRLSTEGLSA
jgi:flagellar protein FlaF